MVEIKIFLDEGDRYEDHLTYEYIMRYLMHNGIKGASIIPVFAGFGHKHHLHIPKSLGSVDEVPLILMFIDEDERVEAVLPHLKQIIKNDFIVKTIVSTP
jgi:PII-like signaling protein